MPLETDAEHLHIIGWLHESLLSELGKLHVDWDSFAKFLDEKDPGVLRQLLAEPDSQLDRENRIAVELALHAQWGMSYEEIGTLA